MEFELYPNYPNPFNPQTTLSYFLPIGGIVTLEVLDLSGRLINRLIDGYKDEGFHSVSWNGMTDFGNAVSSGIYIYQLSVDGQRDFGKMVLLR